MREFDDFLGTLRTAEKTDEKPSSASKLHTNFATFGEGKKLDFSLNDRQPSRQAFLESEIQSFIQEKQLVRELKGDNLAVSMQKEINEKKEKIQGYIQELKNIKKMIKWH